MSSDKPLHVTHVKTQTIIINRLYTLFHSIAITILLYYRISSILTLRHTKTPQVPFIPHLLIFVSEFILSCIWLLSQSFLWRPITRTVFPERLPQDDQLPSIDVFICTADPQKEPPLGVMNTVLSAMALNYPVGKLSVYLSDDAGCSVTLEALQEAWKFSKTWVPFCKKYGVKTICPEAYFGKGELDDDNKANTVMKIDEFGSEKDRIKEEYELFVRKVIKISESERCVSNKNHSAVVEVMFDESRGDQRQVPLLVYVSREKRPSYPHLFKAGSLNALLRVSSLISNSPYILGLDCDMYCNDENSARQAMCFHLDPKLSSSLAFVQFPQMFHNISKHDIYESELRCTFKTLWQGMDGISGPCLSGTCYYIKREAVLYGLPPSTLKDTSLEKLKQSFGSSTKLIKSLQLKHNAKMDLGKNLTSSLLQETMFLASCVYEKDSKWGIEVGFRYFSVVEDYFTSFITHGKKWVSVYYMPSRPSFLGAGTTSLNDVLIQGTRWTAGLIEVALSRFSPIIYGPSRMPVLQSFFYAWLASFPLAFIPLWILATIPQLSLLYGVTVYPEVKSVFFLVFLSVFVLSNLQHLREIHSTGASLEAWKHEQRVWMMKGITSHLYGSIHAIMEKLGAKEASFLPTNKVIDDDQEKLYQMGMYNFQTSSMFLLPLSSLIILNLLAFVAGIVKVTFQREHINEIFVQTFLSFYITLMGYPVLEGMLIRKDKGRIAPSVSCYSVVISIIILSFGKLLVTY
uniref:cellulose synthase-like protein G2 n=1 Tax=Erigeron canadensis TaxID=72917 RepID=UPI001CB8BD50|nr:cellulose synthase-like protein G2 [Erigeron canadensis]